MTHARRVELIEAFSMSRVRKIYNGPLVLTDLGPALKLNQGRILGLRGDLLGSLKFPAYEEMLASERIRALLRDHPDWPLFDGVALSGIEALSFFACALGRKLVVVVPWEFPLHLATIHGEVEIIRADEPRELGYVWKMAQVLRERKNLIPVNQAGSPWALAPVGNRVVQELEILGIRPDATAGVMASGGCMYGIQKKIAEGFSGTETILVECAESSTFDSSLDLRDKEAVKAFAEEKLLGYLDHDPPAFSLSAKDLLFFPLHVDLPNRLWLEFLALTGKVPFDRVVKVSQDAALQVQGRLRKAGFDFGPTTAMALVPAIEGAEQENKTFAAVVYGKGKD